MKRNKTKHNPNQPYLVGAEVVTDPTKKGMHKTKATLVKFGAKLKQADKWLRSFPPINTPDGQEIKRLVLLLPMGYREKKDIIAQYKNRGLTHENARFHMLCDHAGPNNTLVYVKAETTATGSDSDKQHPEESVSNGTPSEPTTPPIVGNENKPEGEANTGSVKVG